MKELEIAYSSLLVTLERLDEPGIRRLLQRIREEISKRRSPLQISRLEFRSKVGIQFDGFESDDGLLMFLISLKDAVFGPDAVPVRNWCIVDFVLTKLQDEGWISEDGTQRIQT